MVEPQGLKGLRENSGFVSGPDFSRAVNDRDYVGLYRLRKNSGLGEKHASGAKARDDYMTFMPGIMLAAARYPGLP